MTTETKTEGDPMAEDDHLTREAELICQRDAAIAQINESRRARRLLTDPRDAERVAAAHAAHDAASAKVGRLETEKAVAESGASALSRRLDDGDETVSVDDIVNAEKAKERAAKLVAPARRELDRAEAALRPLVADQHLAHLATDLLEAVTDVPIVVRRCAEHLPAVAPALVLTQPEPTTGYGTVHSSGTVNVHEVGDPEIDWEAVRRAFEKAGNEGKVSASGIVFDRASWPLVRLREPSMHGLRSLMQVMEGHWDYHLRGGALVERLRAAGVNAQEGQWRGLMKPRPTMMNLAHDQGAAVGTHTVKVAAQHVKGGESLDLEPLADEFNQLVQSLRSEWLGRVTEAGEVVSVTASDLVEVDSDWDRHDVVWSMGSPVWPITAESTISVEFAYEPVEVG